MNRFLPIFALVAMLFVGCTTDETRDVAVDIVAPETLTVSFEGNDSRVQLNEAGKTVWTKGDLVSVFYRSDSHDQYEFQGETGDTEGTLKRTQRGTPSVGLDKIVAVYPYNSNYLIELLTGNIQAFLPATQSYAKDSYGIGSSIMISSSRTNTLYMRNVCGWLKVQIKGNGQIVKRITLKGNNGEQVAGNVFITADTAECTLATALNGADENNSGDLVGTLIEPSTILTEVTLDCGDGVELSAEPTAFYIALPPQTFEKGLTLEIVNANAFKIMTKSTDKELVISRNTIQPMAIFEYDINPQSNNEIWYTATEKVTPYKIDVFGANIVSNEWSSETKHGVITFDGNVTSIGESAFHGCTSLTSVTIPDSVTSIGESAFHGCTSLTSATIPDSVTSIGRSAFYECSRLTSVTIPDSVTEIGNSAFRSCSSLTSITIPDGVTSIGESTFDGCSSLTSVTIPDSVTSIGHWAFYGCTALTSITIPDSVTSIGYAAFADCSSLTSITIPDSVTSIGEGAFCYCSSLISVTIPDRVTSIGYAAFYWCSSLTSITIPDGVTSIGESAFDGCTSLKDVYCKPTTPPTGDIYMFYNNASGRKIYVPYASVEAYKAASYWSSYAYAIIPYDFEKGKLFSILYTATDKVTPYKIDAFGANIISNEWSSKTKQGIIIFDSDVTSIGDDAFYECSRLTSVTIPDSVTSIGGTAFSGCSSLASVTIGNRVTSIGNYAFCNCTSLTSVTIPDSVTEIGESTFYYCTSLTSVTIGNSVTSIGKYAFKNCSSLISVTIGNNVATISMEAFMLCESLKNITIPDSVTYIGYYAFEHCGALENVVIGNSVNTIGRYAFWDCDSLKSITIPDSVTSIEGLAFYQCKSLKDVYCLAKTPPALGDDVFTDCASGKKFHVRIDSLDAYMATWSEYAKSIIADYTPTECTSLTIEADDVPGYMTSTTIRYSAITNGVSFNRYHVMDIPITGEVTSSQFDMNTSLTDSVERTISFSYLGKSATTTIIQGPSLAKSYTVNLNDEWQNSSAQNPDSALYDGVYESFSNYRWNRHSATMYIEIAGYEEFTIYVRRDCEFADNVKIYLDSTLITDTVSNSSDTSLSSYTEVKFSGLNPGPHSIRILYKKDESDHEGADRAYVFIPKNQ